MKDKLILSLLLVVNLVTFLIFVPALNYDMVWDDKALMELNRIVEKEDDPSLILKYPFGINDKGIHSRFYRPVTSFSIWVNYLISSDAPALYHFFNILLHLLVINLVFILVLKLFGDNILAFLSAVFFAVNPVHVPSVVWISGRTDLLAGLFLLFAFFFYIKIYEKKNTTRYLTLSLISFLLAIGSKEVSFVFPLLLIFYDLFRSEWKIKKAWNSINRIYYILMSVLLFFFIMIHGIVIKGAGKRINIFELLLNIKNVFLVFIKYIQVMIFPFNDHGFYFFLENKELDFYIVPFISLIVLLLIVLSLRKSEQIRFALFWTVLFLVPVLLFVGTNKNYDAADHITYLPSIGVSILLGSAIGFALKKIQWKEYRKSIIVFVTLFIILMAYQSLNISKLWKNELSIFGSLYKTSPSAKVSLALGMALSERNYLDKAIEVLKKGSGFDEKDSDIWYELSKIFLKRNDMKGAKYHLLKAVGGRNPNSEIYNNLGNIYYLEKDYFKSESFYLKAIELRPSNVQVMYNLGNIYKLTGRDQKAEHWYKKFISSAPDTKSYKEIKKSITDYLRSEK